MAELHADVIQAKLATPALPHGTVHRTRLHARLDAQPARVILLSAPAGFGKTALVVDWLKRQQASVAWLSVDSSDNDAARFFNHLAAAVGSLPQAEAARAAALVRTLGQRTGPAPDVQEAFAGLGAEAVLVLDDVHELSEPRVLAGLEQLLSVRPPAPRLILLTRVDPPLALGRLRVGGELLELRERDLRFTADECFAFFERLLPGRLDGSLVEQLERRTEGWAAGLRLAAIALHEVPDPAAAVAAFAGSSRIIVDYLVEEAVEKQTPLLQQFLLDTSVLERFTPETCAAVTLEPAARALLAEVEAANLFLVPLGGGEWYRYHHLFRELLEFRLQRLQPERVEVLHERASAWFEQAGDTHAAIEHAARLRDRRRLLELLDAHGFEALVRSELATLARWLEQAPDALTGPYPLLISVVGWLRTLTQRAPDLQAVFAAAEQAFATVPPSYDAGRKLQARTRLEALRAYEARFSGRLDEALLLSRAVLQEVPDNDHFTRGLLVYNMGRLEMVMGDLTAAARLLESAFNDNLRAGNTYLLLTGLGQSATITAQLAGVHRACEDLKAAVALAEQQHLSGLPAFSAVLYHLANVEYLADRLEAARAAAEGAAALARTGNFPEGHANALMILARVAHGQVRWEEAESLLTEMAALARSSNVILLDSTAELEQSRLALAREQAGAGPPSPLIEVDPEGTNWTAYRESATLLALRQALRAREHERAQLLVRSLRREGEARHRGVALAVALVAEALLPAQQARWELLDSGLRLAGTRGYVRPLLEFGELLRPVLQAGLGRPLSAEARAHARLLLDRLERAEPRPASASVPGALLEPLTAREEAVLHCLVEGLSNKAIARSLFVSAETVKTHLKHLYWKLGATSRDQAVARARELGLLASARRS